MLAASREEGAERTPQADAAHSHVGANLKTGSGPSVAFVPLGGIASSFTARRLE